MQKMVIMRVIGTQSYQRDTHLMNKMIILANMTAILMMENHHQVKCKPLSNASLVNRWNLVVPTWVGLLTHYSAILLGTRMYSTSHLIFGIRATSLLKWPSITTSNQCSQNITQLLCSNPDSSSARSFQERT